MLNTHWLIIWSNNLTSIEGLLLGYALGIVTGLALFYLINDKLKKSEETK